MANLKIQETIENIQSSIENSMAALKDIVAYQINTAFLQEATTSPDCCTRKRYEVQGVQTADGKVKFDILALEKGAVYKLLGVQKGKQSLININSEANEQFFNNNSAEDFYLEGRVSGFPEYSEIAFDEINFGSFSPTPICINSYSGIYKDFANADLGFGIVNSGRIFVSNAQPFFIQFKLTNRRGGGIPVFQPVAYLL